MQRPPIPVRPAAADERGVTAAVLARAFIDDPAMAWLFRDARHRAERLRRFFGLITRVDGDPALWTLALDGGRPAAAAMWRPPGAWATPTSAMLRLLPAMIHAFGLSLPRALALQNRLEAHHPAAPHWYLQFVGCEPAAQGKGLGGAAIRDRLATCDAQRLPAALETATPGNLGLYQALGFVITDTFAIDDSLTFWTMWRDPR
ncbi:MAG: GNAT family N-acetyltransferase [Alphaproteobacteria bacterium]|nr:MAG: GNAT family N-acetyltransferase [Alphaproteobacteria bacterium]